LPSVTTIGFAVVLVSLIGCLLSAS
jgi:hypothetical protein